MRRLVRFTFLLCFTVSQAYPTFKGIPPTRDVGVPLFVTLYIEEGRIKEGQTAAMVMLPRTHLTSYSGYFTVNKTYSSNMFFWYFPSETDPENAPVVLWLQGGPGGSSLVGLFCENGPFHITGNLSLKHRKYYWSQALNVLYIDNPVGTGFSFTESDAGYPRDEEHVGRDLYSALSQFFQLFPHLQKNDFFISGESYAGKYVPAIAYTIHNNNRIKKHKINLKGMAIGNGFTDPINMLDFCDYVYNIGLIDSSNREIMRQQQNKLVESIRQEKYIEAETNFEKLLEILYRQAGYNLNIYNYLHYNVASNCRNIDAYVQSDQIRRRLHVGKVILSNGDKPREFLLSDYFKSVRPWVAELLENYRVLFYSGQLDIVVPYPMTVNFLQKLEWSGSDSYKTAPRKMWMVDGELAGYAKTAGRLTEVLVRNAGHMVPQDQPKWSLDLITRLAFNRSF